MAVDNPEVFNRFINELATVTNKEITRFDDLIEALHSRHTYFHEAGGRLSDHGISTFYAGFHRPPERNWILFSVIPAATAQPDALREWHSFKTAILLAVCEWNHERQWTQQFHVGAIRNNNSRLLQRVRGRMLAWILLVTGALRKPCSAFLDALDKKDKLDKDSSI